MTTLEQKAHSTIMLCLADDIITEVVEEETSAGLWLKLESLYFEAASVQSANAGRYAS